MSENVDGQIITFYSYKGGTGRTMALANVAWILAENGKRVLVADWDLESPGLHRYLAPFLNVNPANEPGIVDLIRVYRQDYAKFAQVSPDDTKAETRLISDRARVRAYAISVEDWDFGEGGLLDYLPAGRQNSEYAPMLSALDWDTFYDQQSGGAFLDALRADMKRNYDYILIDSRTGHSDVADICTLHLPDVLVDCFTLSTQGIEGAAQVAGSIVEKYSQVREIRILPVPMRVDLAEKERADIGHQVAVRKFTGLPADMTDTERRDYWSAVEVPYQAFYAYEETLATFGDRPGSPQTLLAAFERLTGYITNGAITKMPLMEEQKRIDTLRRFTRRRPIDTPHLVIDYAPEDEVWSDWISEILTSAGAQVMELGSLKESRRERTPEIQVVRLVTSPDDNAPGKDEPHFVIYLDAARPLTRYSGRSTAVLSGMNEADATDRLMRLFNLTSRRQSAMQVRFPAYEPKIVRAPGRNTRFTGREADLKDLRRKLRDQGRAVVLPVTVHGLGGVGKTQVALEYVHRFKTDYDVIWWLDCGQAQFIDTALAELGAEIERRYQPIAPAGVAVTELAPIVVQALSDGQPVEKWLLVYDNADEIGEIERLIPAGTGHVVITSRNAEWTKRGTTSLEVDVFSRGESVEHLTQRVEGLTEDEARSVAAALGDLPLAVATAGAWLAETGIPVSTYLQELRREGPRILSLGGQLADYRDTVARTWDLSLNRLAERSSAAYRLFELCALCAPDINTDLLYSRKTADLLAELDPSLKEPMVIGRLVQEINRLALLKTDANSKQIHVHRLVQAVVRARMTPDRLEQTRRDVHQILASAKPKADVDEPKSWPEYRRLWPHLEPSKAETSTDDEVRQLLIDRVRYLFHVSDSQRGIEMGVLVRNEWQRQLDERPELAETSLPQQLLLLQFNMGNTLRQLDRFVEAKELDEKVYAQQMEMLGREHPHTLMTASGLTASLRAMGAFEESLELDQVTYPAWRELYGEEYFRTMIAANNLATSYRSVGQFAKALALDEATLVRRRAVLGPQHPRTLDSHANVARDLLEAGRYQEAVEAMNSVLDAFRQSLGSESRSTLNAHVLLGVALRSVGKEQEAASSFTTGLDGLTRRVGPEHTDALACRLSNSGNLLSLGRYMEADDEIRWVLARYRKRLGPDHPHVLACQINLASALRLQGQYDEALETIKTAVAGLCDALGDGHPYTLAANMVYAVIKADLAYREGNRAHLEEAEAIEAATFTRMEEALGPNHPDTLRCRANHLLTRIELGDSYNIGARDQIQNQLAQILGAAHPNITTLRDSRRLVRAVDPQPY